MDQTHSRALEALQPFIHLANSTSATSPRFIANLITNVTSNPQTYVFAELLESPTVQALRSPDTPAEYQGYLTLLEIFAWGTWQEYQTTPNLPKLNRKQELKLRLLSLLTLSATTKPLTYSTLMTALSLSSPADLESLVTTAIYASLIAARLSPATTPPTVNVTAVAPLRDVQPQSLPKMISLLTVWEARCGEVVSDLEAEIARVRADAAKRRAKEQAHRKLFEEAVAHRLESTGIAGVGGDNMAAGRNGNKAVFGRRGAGAVLRSGAGMGRNKREYNADDVDDDDGFWEPGDGMDIDEGAGSSSRVAGSRHSKRILGKKS